MYEIIEKFCKERDVPIAIFERICGFSSGYILKLKTSTPGAKALKRIAQVLGVTMDELSENL